MRVFHVFHQTKANFSEIRSVWISDFIDVWIGDWKRGQFSTTESNYRKDSIFFETGSMPRSCSTTFSKRDPRATAVKSLILWMNQGVDGGFLLAVFALELRLWSCRHHNLNPLDHSILCLLLPTSQNAGSISLYMDYSRQSKTKLAFLILRIKM